MKKGLFARPAALLLTLGLLAFSPVASFAADFAAEIVDVYGQVLITPKATGKAVAAVKGMKLAPGDALETKAKAELELLYDDGNITRIDEKTKITIMRMSLEDDKSKQTILDLTVGRVKNSVSKLSHEKSKFEVQTMSAVAGVTGTPPWIVAAIGEPGKKQKVEVDLLPEKVGAANHTAGVFVKGVGAGAAMVTLTPGTRTFASAGAPPVVPVPISPARLQQLQTAMKITTPPQVQEQKKKELEQKIEEKKEESKKEEKKGKEEAKKEEEKKGEEKKEESKKEDSGKNEESKKDASKEESKGENKESTSADSKETKTDTATSGDKGKAADAGGGKTDASTGSESSGGGASAAANSAGTSTASVAPAVDATVASSTAAPSTGAFAGGFTGGTGAAGPADTSGMMNHLANNVSVGKTVPGTQASATGDATGAAALPGANQNALPAAMTKVRVLVTITNK